MNELFYLLLRRICPVLTGCFLLAAPAFAFEADLNLDSASDDLKDDLKSASLVLSAKRDGTTNPQDILAAAQADYGRLVSAFYERGYYGPVVSIRVDGREAAEIPPLANLGQISRIQLNVKSGPAFKLGEAKIAPTTKETEIPKGFSAGEPAELSVIRDAAQAGVEGWRAVGYAKAKISRENVVADHPKRAAQR